MRHLSHDEIKHLEYSTASGYLHNGPINVKAGGAINMNGATINLNS